MKSCSSQRYFYVFKVVQQYSSSAFLLENEESFVYIRCVGLGASSVRLDDMELALRNVHRQRARIGDGAAEKRNRRIVDEILTYIRVNLLTVPLCRSLFTDVFYGGSYWDKLKIVAADEYDVDFLFRLPETFAPKLIPYPDKPYYMSLKLCNYKDTAFRRFVSDDGCLMAGEMNDWFEAELRSILGRRSSFDGFKVSLTATDPAKCLLIDVEDGTRIKIDLVIAFRFDGTFWPQNFKDYGKCKGFQIVPEPSDAARLLWRPSFQRQERDLLHDNGFVKSALRLIKLLLLTENMLGAFTSYYLKTMVLLELERHAGLFKGKSLSFTFMHLLRQLYGYVRQRRLPYFWNEGLNLIANVDLLGMEKLIGTVIDDLEAEPANVRFYFDVREDLVSCKRFAESFELSVESAVSTRKRC